MTPVVIDAMNNISNYFCTIIGKAYLIKGLSLYLSLSQNIKEFSLWICCMDNEIYDILNSLNLSNVVLYRLEDIEDDELKAAKENRSFREYCWTMKAPFILHIFENYSYVDHILYLDADTYLFGSTEEIYEEWGDGSILLCKQRDDQNDDIYGIYQAGVIGFKKDINGLECLNWWRSKCIEWCYDRYDDPIRWGDQKYMNNWPEIFHGVVVVKSLGINTAAWYLKYYNFSLRKNNIYIENDRLILFHFTSFFILNENEFTFWKWNNLKIIKRVKKLVYLPYVKTVKRAKKMIEPFTKNIHEFYSSDINKNNVSNYFRSKMWWI